MEVSESAWKGVEPFRASLITSCISHTRRKPRSGTWPASRTLETDWMHARTRPARRPGRGPPCSGESGMSNSNDPFKLERFMKMLPRSLRKSKAPAAAAISKKLEETIESTEYWAKRMPREAVRLVRKERLFGIAAGGLSLFTGFLVWPVVADSSALTVQILVSGLSGLAALAIAAPYASGLSDRGEDSIKLGSTYGAMHRELLRAREQVAAGSVTSSSQLSPFYGQLDYIEERRDSLGIRARPERVNAFGVPLVREVGRRGRAVPIPPRKYTRRSAPSTGVNSGRTVVVDRDAVATLIYLLTTQLASQNQNSTTDFTHRSFPFQSDAWEQDSAGRLEPYRQLALPFEPPRSPDSGRRDHARLNLALSRSGLFRD
jgi:hypothetical protein